MPKMYNQTVIIHNISTLFPTSKILHKTYN